MLFYFPFGKKKQPPTVREIALQQLQEAERELLDAEASHEYHTTKAKHIQQSADMLRGRISRLNKYNHQGAK